MSKPETTLKIATEEIKDILKKYNLGAAIALHTPGHGEYFIHTNPSYSCAYMYNDNEVRFYSKGEDYKSKEEQIKKQADTANMLYILQQITGDCFLNLEYLSKTFDKTVNAKHF